MLYVHYVTLCIVVQGKFTILGVFKVSCCIDFWLRASGSIIVKVCVCVHIGKYRYGSTYWPQY